MLRSDSIFFFIFFFFSLVIQFYIREVHDSLEAGLAGHWSIVQARDWEPMTFHRWDCGEIVTSV